MFKALAAIIAIGVVAYAVADIDGQSALFAVLLPLVMFLSIVLFAIWLVLFIHRAGLYKEKGIQKVENSAPVASDDIGGFGDGGCQGVDQYGQHGGVRQVRTDTGGH